MIVRKNATWRLLKDTMDGKNNTKPKEMKERKNKQQTTKWIIITT